MADVALWLLLVPVVLIGAAVTPLSRPHPALGPRASRQGNSAGGSRATSPTSLVPPSNEAARVAVLELAKDLIASATLDHREVPTPAMRRRWLEEID